MNWLKKLFSRGEEPKEAPKPVKTLKIMISIRSPVRAQQENPLEAPAQKLEDPVLEPSTQVVQDPVQPKHEDHVFVFGSTGGLRPQQAMSMALAMTPPQQDKHLRLFAPGAKEFLFEKNARQTSYLRSGRKVRSDV